jgi:hypothetical protein
MALVLYRVMRMRLRTLPHSGCGPPTITTALIWPWAESPRSSAWPWLHKHSTSGINGNWGDYRGAVTTRPMHWLPLDQDSLVLVNEGFGRS